MAYFRKNWYSSLMPRTIKQKVKFKTTPHAVFEALMDAKQHAAFSGAEAKISRKTDGKFTAYGDYIEGVNLELVADQIIVQKWRASDWPKEHYSIATFRLRPDKGGTELVFTQTNIPDNKAKTISEGWKEHYWDKMKLLLEKK